MSFVELSAVLGNWGEFIGSIAVVATLIYLAIQVRQNSQQIRDNVNSLQVSAYQHLMARIAEYNRLGIENVEFQQIVRKAAEDPAELDQVEYVRYVTQVISLIRHADMAFMQYEKGLLDFERYQSSLGPFLGTLATSALARAHVRMTVELENIRFTRSFKQELLRLLHETPLQDESSRLFYRQRVLEMAAEESRRQ